MQVLFFIKKNEKKKQSLTRLTMEPLNIPNKIRVIINEIHIMRIRNMTTKENNNNNKKKRGAKLEVFFKLGARTRKRLNDRWRDKTTLIHFFSSY